MLAESPGFADRLSVRLSKGSYRTIGAAVANPVSLSPRIERVETGPAPVQARLILAKAPVAAGRTIVRALGGSYRTIGGLTVRDQNARVRTELKWISPAPATVVQRLARRAIVEKRSTAYRRLLRGPLASPSRGLGTNALNLAWAVPLTRPAVRVMPHAPAAMPCESSHLKLGREALDASVREWTSGTTLGSEWIRPRIATYVRGIAPVHHARIRAAAQAGLSRAAQVSLPSIVLNSKPTVGPKVRLPRFTARRTVSTTLVLMKMNHIQGAWPTAPRSGTVALFGATSPELPRAAPLLPANTRSALKRLPCPFRPCGLMAKDVSVKSLEFLPLVKAVRRINLGDQPVSQAVPALRRRDLIQGFHRAAPGRHDQASPAQRPKLPSPASFAVRPGVKVPTMANIGITPRLTAEIFTSSEGTGPGSLPPSLSPVRVPTASVLAPPALSGVILHHQISGPTGLHTGVFLKIHEAATRGQLGSDPVAAVAPARMPDPAREHPRSAGIRHYAPGTFSYFAGSELRG